MSTNETRAFNHDWLVIDADARPIAGPSGPLVVSWKEGQRLIKTEPWARELASTEQWQAVFTARAGDTGFWRLKNRSW